MSREFSRRKKIADMNFTRADVDSTPLPEGVILVIANETSNGTPIPAPSCPAYRTCRRKPTRSPAFAYTKKYFHCVINSPSCSRLYG
jgi:hypothetical protein